MAYHCSDQVLLLLELLGLLWRSAVDLQLLLITKKILILII